MSDPKVRLPLYVFEKMVASVGPADLIKLPPQQLPLYIPPDFISRVPAQSVSAVESLLFEAESHRMSQRMDAERVLGAGVASALDVVSGGGSAVLAGVFPKKFAQAKSKQKENPNDPSLSKDIEHLNDLSDEIFTDAISMVSALKILLAAKQKESEVQGYIGDCYDMLLDLLRGLHRQMDEHALFRLKVLGPNLKQLGAKAQSAAKELEQLKQSIPETEKHMKSIAKTQNIRKDQMGTHPQIQSLQQQLLTLKARKETLEVLVSKDELHKHMDLIVNGVLIEKDASKKIAMYSYQLWPGVHELIVDFVRASLPASDTNKVPEQTKQFINEYFVARKTELDKVLGGFFPTKNKLFDAIKTRVLG